MSIDISILLPTRGRSDMLMRSLFSLHDLATDFSTIEILFGMDNNDAVGLENMLHHVIPWIEQHNIAHKIVIFEPMGYHNLHRYLNGLAESSKSPWLFFWNDDAIMKTQGWDTYIRAKTGEFKLLSVITHNEHPYSIFPIIPRAWYETLGHISQHSLNDAWVSCIAYALDIFERLPIYCDHERADLTGTNNDDTYQRRTVLEGDKANPLDFNYPEVVALRMQDAAALAQWLQDVKNQDMSFFADCCKGTRDPWVKMRANDPNKQVTTMTVERLNKV
ncbi:MAG: hypothetical protein EBU08_05350 [Micrococcales bacterium]|nr:hypothetical protein [Micrococcales bacterium]